MNSLLENLNNEQTEIVQKYCNGNFENNEKYVDEFYDAYIANFKQTTKKKYLYKFIKRCFDFFVSLIALIVLLPLFLIVAIAIKIDSRGPVFFVQHRMGKNNKVFKCIKFRSMKKEAPKEMATSVLEHPEMHITRVGKFIRKFSIDELPQLINCLNGTMSIIGPRPVVLTEEKLIKLRTQLGVYNMKPGISGYAQVNGRDDVYYKNKALLDAEYVKKASLWLDFKLILKTVVIVLKRDGNNSEKQK